MPRRSSLTLAALVLAGGAAMWYIRQKRSQVAPTKRPALAGKSNDLVVSYSGTVAIPVDVAASFAKEAVRRVLS